MLKGQCYKNIFCQIYDNVLQCNKDIAKVSSKLETCRQANADCLLKISSSGIGCFPVVDHPRGVEVGDPVEVRVQDVNLEGR